MLKVLILGSNSFIGKHLIKHLSEERKDVLLTLFGKNLPDDLEKLRFIQGDFRDAESLKKALEGQDIVYHFISSTIPANSWDLPLIEVERNLLPFLKFIELSAQSGIRKVCFASSGGTVYGYQQDLLTEESLTEPFSPYGIIKRACESFLQYARQRYQMNYDIYRVSNVYGEGQDVGKGLGFINTALERIVNNQPVLIYGDGENIRDYIDVCDVAKLLTLSITKDITDSDTYNISSNNPVSLNKLIELMKNVLDLDFEVKYEPTRASDNRKVLLNNSRVLHDFGQIDLTSLEDGIKKTYNYLKSQQPDVEKRP
jgi:UDP-glucose 4-epimerase